MRHLSMSDASSVHVYRTVIPAFAANAGNTRAGPHGATEHIHVQQSARIESEYP
jgi:hypothetical protein